ncbi:alpha/beta fold hydrolase [Sphingomonas sp. MMS24-JH45]
MPGGLMRGMTLTAPPRTRSSRSGCGCLRCANWRSARPAAGAGAPWRTRQDHGRSWDWVAERLRHDWHVVPGPARTWRQPMGARRQLRSAPPSSLRSGATDLSARSRTGDDRVARSAATSAALHRPLSRHGAQDRRDRENPARQGPGRARRHSVRRPLAQVDHEQAHSHEPPSQALRHVRGRLVADEGGEHLSHRRTGAAPDHPGMHRNEDGTWSWKFDNHPNVWPIFDLPQAKLEQLWQAIDCPTLLYGADSWASNPQKDGRIAHFRHARVTEYENAGHWLHHDQFDHFMGDLAAFLY